MRKVLLSAAALCMSMLFGVSAFAADIDVTNKVGTSLDAWTCENGKKNSVTIDGIVMVENFQDGSTSTSASTTGVVLWQDVAGLDNGNYTVELWANARVAWQDSPATDGQEELTYLVANNVEISMQVFLNPGLNNNATYVLEGVEVTDGTLHIEMNKKAAGSNWHSIQIKKLTYHASDDEALIAAKADLKAALDAAAAVAPASEALTAAIAVAQGVYDASTDIEEVKAAVAPLQAATAFAVNVNSVAGATVAAPVVTNFVVNGTFDTTTSPWKTTTGAQNQALASNQTGAFTGKFFENWNPSNYTGKIYQVIENIPNGLYELSICAFVNNFVAGANYVYANADKQALTTGAPTAYTVRTTVTDNVIEIGLEQVEAVNEWMGIDNVSLKYFGEVDENYAKDIYASTKAEAEALLTAKMSAEALATLQAALAVEVDETSDEALLAAEAALQEAMNSVKASVNFFANNKKAIDAMFALMESTNVYTAEAYSTYAALAEEYLASYEAGTLTATVDNPATVHGWHAEVAYDDLLLSAFGTNNFESDLYINTWSTEGEGDGSEFKVPFFEYWTGDANSLGATTKTATVTGLVAGKVYELSAWVRTRAKDGVAAAEATGITLNVGAGDTVDVTEGVVVGESQFAHAVYTAYGVADENGTLTINFNVLADNNVSWLSFKNLKYAEVPENHIFANGYAEQISEGNHYVFYTDAEGNNHFLNAAGQNNWVVSADPVTIAFSNGNITDAFAGAASFMASNGFYMSNAANSDGSGAIKTEPISGNNGQSKRTWESQVFYKNAAGKYAIRLTNATGTSWGANCFVNIDPATLAVVSGQPTLGDALYLWEIADEDDPRFSTQVIAGLIEKAEALTAIYNKEVKAALDAVVAAAKVATPSEVMAVKAQLEEAIAAAEASIAEYEAIARQLVVSNSVLVGTAIGYDDFAAAIAAAEATYADSTATAESLTVLTAATTNYLAANEVEGIVNGNFANGTTGWTGGMGTGNHNKWTNVNDQFVEKWTAAPGTLADMDFYQEISGLPAGTYTFAAYVSACQQANEDSYEVTGVKLYANGDSVAVHTINIDRDATNKAIGAEFVTVTTTIADGETLKIGMNIASTDANWVVMDNAKLYNFDNPCRKTYNVVLEDVKVASMASETVISAEVMAEIVELLGAPASELTFQLVDTTGVRTDYNGNPGEVLFWVDLEGNHSNWGVNNKFFLMYDSVAQTITSTQYGVAEGDVLNATVRLANAEGDYVVIKLTESIFVSPIINIADFEVVSTITVKHVEPTGVTYSGATASFDPISTASALGVASLDEAEQYILNVTTGNLVANTTDGWRDANGDAANWGAEGGVCVKIQQPSSGSIDYIGCIDTTHEHGEVYTAKWAFVHEGKAVVIEVVIIFETAGIENIEAIQNAVIYTISGKRVQGDVDSLERGIYIVNGKKVFVK